MEKIHTVTIKGKDYPFAYSLSVFTRASAMPGAKDSDLILEYAIIYQALLKGHKRDKVKFPFPYGDEGVDHLTDLLSEDPTAMNDIRALVNECSVQMIETMGDDTKKNSPSMSSSDTPLDTASLPTSGNQNHESLKTSFSDGVIVT